MFNSDIVIYNFLKKILIKIVPVFGFKLGGVAIGGFMFDILVIVTVALLTLSKVNKIQEKVKK